MTWAPSEDSDQPRHPPSLIRVFAVRIKKHWVLNYLLSALQRLWSHWADAQADLSLRWAHMPFCWFCHEVAHISCTLFLEEYQKDLSTFKILYHKNHVVFTCIRHVNELTCKETLVWHLYWQAWFVVVDQMPSLRQSHSLVTRRPHTYHTYRIPSWTEKWAISLAPLGMSFFKRACAATWRGQRCGS